jgi:spore germination protein GerM
LKQNRAIRFASPTPEHRCYVSGEAQDIPVDQSSYCLCQEHINCPLYMGLSVSSMATTSRTADDTREQGGVRAWLSGLSLRDRLIYGTLLSVMLIILSIYMVLAVQLFFYDGSGGVADAASGSPTPAPAGAALAEPTPSSTAVPATAVPAPTSTAASSALPPASVPLTPTQAATPTATSGLVADNEPPRIREPMTLYFADASNTLFVPQTRRARVPENPNAVQLAEAALRELLRGPLNGSGLNAVVPGNVQLLGVDQVGGTLVVNLDTGGDTLSNEAIRAIVLTLTDLPDLATAPVQVQVNGSNVGLGDSDKSVSRFAFNVHNPLGLDESFSSRDTSFLTLYYVNDATGDYVRVTRLVPRTQSVARATVNELLNGPGSSYAGLLTQPIPQGTELIDVYFDSEAPADDTLVVNLSAAFAQATDQQAALDTLVLSLTNLSTVQHVDVRIEGQPLADVWGADFAGPFDPPPLNPEGL